MSICVFANGQVGVSVVKFLLQNKEKISILVLHNVEDSRNHAELTKLGLDNGIQIALSSDMREPSFVDLLATLNLTFGVSAFFNHILGKEILDIFSNGVVNLHTSFLPWNKGSNPNVWSIIKEDPVGVTLHFMNEQVDAGPIIVRESFEAPINYTGKELYLELESRIVALFRKSWPLIKDHDFSLIQQDDLIGTVNLRKSLESLKLLDLNAKKTIREVLNILRACTFPPHPSAYFISNGKRFDVEIKITERELDNL